MLRVTWKHSAATNVCYRRLLGVLPTSMRFSSATGSSRPELSIIVVLYDMEREARRSLHSLSTAYQQGVTEDQYEVIVIDNGSPRPFNGGSVKEFGSNFSYHYVPNANASPARAVRLGTRLARSDYLAIMVDGARILTPGVIRYGLMLPGMFANPFGFTLGWHLGSDLQCRSLRDGYDRKKEDALLAKIRWPEAPYRLFEISSAHDPSDGWFRLVGETNFTFLKRSLFDRVGAFDERFRARGGGLVNLDLQACVYELPDVDLVVLLGEGTFHQFHGGATSGTSWDDIPELLYEFQEEYQMIRHKRFTAETERRPAYVGHIPKEAMGFLRQFVDSAELRFTPVKDRLSETKRDEEKAETLTTLQQQVTIEMQ